MLKQYIHIKDIFIDFKKSNNDLVTNLYYFFIFVLFYMFFIFISYSPIFEGVGCFYLYTTYFGAYYLYFYNMLKFFFYDYEGRMPIEIEYMLYSFFSAYLLTAIIYYRNEMYFNFAKFDITEFGERIYYPDHFGNLHSISQKVEIESEQLFNDFFFHKVSLYQNFFNDMTIKSKEQLYIVDITKFNLSNVSPEFDFIVARKVTNYMYIHSALYPVFAIFFLALIWDVFELLEEYVDELFVDYLKNNPFIFDIFVLAFNFFFLFFYMFFFDDLFEEILTHRLILSRELLFFLSPYNV